jgi:alanine dehydrogenase
MKISFLKENNKIKTFSNDSIIELKKRHQVFIEGVDDKNDVYNADIIIKISQLSKHQIKKINPKALLISSFNFNINPKYLLLLLKKGISCLEINLYGPISSLINKLKADYAASLLKPNQEVLFLKYYPIYDLIKAKIDINSVLLDNHSEKANYSLQYKKTLEESKNKDAIIVLPSRNYIRAENLVTDKMINSLKKDAKIIDLSSDKGYCSELIKRHTKINKPLKVNKRLVYSLNNYLLTNVDLASATLTKYISELLLNIKNEGSEPIISLMNDKNITPLVVLNNKEVVNKELHDSLFYK